MGLACRHHVALVRIAGLRLWILTWLECCGPLNNLQLSGDAQEVVRKCDRMLPGTKIPDASLLGNLVMLSNNANPSASLSKILSNAVGVCGYLMLPEAETARKCFYQPTSIIDIELHDHLSHIKLTSSKPCQLAPVSDISVLGRTVQHRASRPKIDLTLSETGTPSPYT